MSRKPGVGGVVQISGKSYTVVTPPVRRHPFFRMTVADENGDVFCARNEAWRSGKGPWKIDTELSEAPTAMLAPQQRDTEGTGR